MKYILKIFSTGLLIISFSVVTLTIFLVGYIKGVSSIPKPTPTPSPSPRPIIRYTPSSKPSSSWGGPDLWDAVNKPELSTE